jgi:hypothetical protein
MSRLSLALGLSVLVLSLGATDASALNVVSTNWQVNCVFSPSCTVYVTDHASDFAVPGAAGMGRLQSRIWTGQAGSPAAGKYAYVYRVIMTNTAGLTYVPYVDQIAIGSTGPVLQYDYNFDANATDHVWYSTSGLGSKGVSSVFTFWGWNYFSFTSPIYSGSYIGGGESSYFFGFASNYPPVLRNISVHTDSGWVTVTGYAPQYP